MTKLEERKALHAKIIKGLEKCYQDLIEYKRQKNSVLVVVDKDGKIVKLKP
jgi:hypothetical protein